jgi:hypothetical protein
MAYSIFTIFSYVAIHYYQTKVKRGTRSKVLNQSTNIFIFVGKLFFSKINFDLSEQIFHLINYLVDLLLHLISAIQQKLIMLFNKLWLWQRGPFMLHKGHPIILIWLAFFLVFFVGIWGTIP